MREIREKRGITSNELCALLNVASGTVSRWEAGKREPGIETINRLVTTLNTSIAYLMGETDDPAPSRADKTRRVDADTDADIEISAAARVDFAKSAGKSIPVPVFGHELSACCGEGFPNADQIFAEAEEFIAMPSAFLGPYDPERPPFIIYADGDSMVDAGINDGSQVIINPADPVLDGDAALVEFAVNPVVRNIAVKRVYWLDNHGVEIRSACGDGWRRRFTRADGDEKSVRIIGKVEWAGNKPKRG